MVFSTRRSRTAASDDRPTCLQIGFWETQTPYLWGGLEPDSTGGVWLPKYESTDAELAEHIARGSRSSFAGRTTVLVRAGTSTVSSETSISFPQSPDYSISMTCYGAISNLLIARCWRVTSIIRPPPSCITNMNRHGPGELNLTVERTGQFIADEGGFRLKVNLGADYGPFLVTLRSQLWACIEDGDDPHLHRFAPVPAHATCLNDYKLWRINR